MWRVEPAAMRQEYVQLLTGRLPKIAPRQVDQVEEVNFQNAKSNHRLSFRYDRELEDTVLCVIDNSTGEAVKHVPSKSQVDHALRMKKLMGLHIDLRA